MTIGELRRAIAEYEDDMQVGVDLEEISRLHDEPHEVDSSAICLRQGAQVFLLRPGHAFPA